MPDWGLFVGMIEWQARSFETWAVDASCVDCIDDVIDGTGDVTEGLVEGTMDWHESSVSGN